MVGMSAAETMLTAASKASDRALLNMTRMDVSSSENCFEREGKELKGLGSSEQVEGRNERLGGWWWC